MGIAKLRCPRPRVKLAEAVAPLKGGIDLCYGSTMITMSARDANQNFAKMLSAVERGETVLITKNGKTVAELRPRVNDPREDPEWRAAFETMVALMRATPATGYRVGKITEDDKYGDAPL